MYLVVIGRHDANVGVPEAVEHLFIGHELAEGVLPAVQLLHTKRQTGDTRQVRAQHHAKRQLQRGMHAGRWVGRTPIHSKITALVLARALLFLHEFAPIRKVVHRRQSSPSSRHPSPFPKL